MSTPGLEPGHTGFQPVALPAELCRRALAVASAVVHVAVAAVRPAPPAVTKAEPVMLVITSAQLLVPEVPPHLSYLHVSPLGLEPRRIELKARRSTAELGGPVGSPVRWHR